MKDFNYDEWQSKYHNEEFIDLKKFLDIPILVFFK